MSQVLIQRPGLDGAVTGWTLQRHGEQKGRAQASKTKLHLGKMKPKQSKQCVVAAGFSLSPFLPVRSSTSTRPLFRSQPLQIQLQILPGPAALPFPQVSLHCPLPIAHYSVEGTRISPVALAHLPPRVAQVSHVPGTGAAGTVLSQ